MTEGADKLRERSAEHCGLYTDFVREAMEQRRDDDAAEALALCVLTHPVTLINNAVRNAEWRDQGWPKPYRPR